MPHYRRDFSKEVLTLFTSGCIFIDFFLNLRNAKYSFSQKEKSEKTQRKQGIDLKNLCLLLFQFRPNYLFFGV